jgi:hypothetical protein
MWPSSEYPRRADRGWCASWGAPAWRLAVLGLALGCTEPRSPVCVAVCKREAECIEELSAKLPFDEKECIAACSALERDATHNAAKVKRHVDCVLRQPACSAVLECK